ncbi:MAG: RES family NAD+ phosphorylase, partial [Acidobacteriota bacterium]
AVGELRQLRREEHQHLPGIGPEELVFAVPHAAVINAAFCHAHPLGSRFSGPDRGAWYAAFDVATSQREVAFHKAVQLAEIGRFEDSVTYDDYRADFSATFHDLRRARRAFSPCLDPDSYVASQQLAEHLLAAGALGVVYPSVRHDGGTCVAAFRPALVMNVRKARTYRFTWSGAPVPKVTIERPVA